jgi:predicted lipoprotein with Yx(FWY)xxD motif
MSFRLSFHLAPLDATEPHQPDGAADLSCEDGTRQHATDGCPLSCKQQVGGSSPGASSKDAECLRRMRI